jgi:hypothetical protein
VNVRGARLLNALSDFFVLGGGFVPAEPSVVPSVQSETYTRLAWELHNMHLFDLWGV